MIRKRREKHLAERAVNCRHQRTWHLLAALILTEHIARINSAYYKRLYIIEYRIQQVCNKHL